MTEKQFTEELIAAVSPAITDVKVDSGISVLYEMPRDDDGVVQMGVDTDTGLPIRGKGTGFGQDFLIYEEKTEWTKKGGTLSDKTAFKEFGLTQNDIIKAIHEGKLQFRDGSIYGNPYLRLLRSEVEKLASERFGKDLFNKKKAKNELKKINKERKELKSKIAELEIRKNELTHIIKA